MSLALRKRILNAVDQGDSTQLRLVRRVVESLGFVKKLLNQPKRTGSIENFHNRSGDKQSVPRETLTESHSLTS